MDDKAGLEINKAAQTTAPRVSGRVKPVGAQHDVRRSLKVIREAYSDLVYGRRQITGAYEWLYDNFYILEREGVSALRDLKAARGLPRAANGEAAVYLHALSLCCALRGNIDAAGIEEYIAAAQRVRDFDSGELSAFGLMLRAALIRQAAEGCDQDIGEETRARLLAGSVRALNFLSTFDFSLIIERQSCVERILSEDPSGAYPKMDERSRALYRDRLGRIAGKRSMSESDAARLAVELAKNAVSPRERHVGFYILERELDRRKKDVRGRIYLWLLAAAPAAAAVAAAFACGAPWAAVLLWLPAWEVLRPFIDRAVMKGVKPAFLPRFDYGGAVPEDCGTLVVVSALLSSPEKAEQYLKRLEQFYASNGRGNVMFGLLADLKGADLPEKPEDKAIAAAAVKAVKRLNERCGAHFFVMLRARRYCAAQGNFCGWERKRGAITELVRFIKGGQTSVMALEGDESRIRRAKYIITLDADTALEMDAAAEMVSAASHPLNVPEIDPETGIVRHGYGILCPRVGIDLASAGSTPFSRIMAGAGGVSAYDDTQGDVYQDLFGEGIFSGKGIIDVDAYYRVLDETMPENTVLSHDIVEGCCLRAGFLSDVEMTDGFPPRPGPWYDRMHRWIRGDFQNVVFLGRTIPAKNGRRASPFGALSRFKLLDNLRRAATPVLSLGCFIAAAFLQGPSAAVLAAAAAAGVAWGGVWAALTAIVRGGPYMLSGRYHCRVLPEALDLMARAAVSFIFLPVSAAVALDAAVRALIRLGTKKRLLEWTTAAESEAKGPGGSGALRFWGAALFGAAAAFFALTPGVKALGAVFILSPLVSWLSGRPTQPSEPGLSQDERARLRSYAAAMWRYYEDFTGAADHFLPPDNVQEAPVRAAAHRTSPTNIGLYLLSCLGARDLGLIDSAELLKRVGDTAAALCTLQKWNGHLYNWYDTKTLRPMKPEYVSTVDSGNLLCCLTALCEGLREYADEENFAPVTGKLEKLRRECDLSLLYNKRRRLFHIGFDVAGGKLSDSYYDLMMSEARMTSYYAVAMRQAPKRHWGALGRTLTRCGGYTGPVSWTGTMFEYLMPHLLLPVYEDSLPAEALRFAVYCQKRRVKDMGLPWGISESGFYAFDASLSYQYGAHGVQRLALRRGMDSELVLSPYSTFLALPFDPGAAMKNLRRFEKIGMYGRCGFFEAVDYTYSRTRGRPALVRSYMAHHVGMSLVATVNALTDGVMQARFMRDRQMGAAHELLEEKIPISAAVFRDVLRREVPEKPGRAALSKETFTCADPFDPRVRVVTNGEYTLLMTDSGASETMFRGFDLTRRTLDFARAPYGVYAVMECGGEKLCATAAPMYSAGRVVRRETEFTTTGAEYTAMSPGCGISVKTCVHGRLPCEARRIETANFSPRPLKAKLLIYFEPSLAKASDEAAHPAFSRLFLSARYRSDSRIVVFSRRTLGTEPQVCLAAGFEDGDMPFEFEFDRSELLGRPEGIASLPGALDAVFDGRTGAAPDPAAAFRLSFTLPARGKSAFTFLLAAAETADEAAAKLIEARREGWNGIRRDCAGKDGDNIEARLTSLMLPDIIYPRSAGKEADEARAQCVLGQQGLWSLGISGDYPIILFSYSSSADAERLNAYARAFRSMRLAGIAADFVIIYREGGDYSRQTYRGITETLRDSGCECLVGAPQQGASLGGIHLVDLDRHEREIYVLLLASACHIAPGGPDRRETRRTAPEIMRLTAASPADGRSSGSIGGVPSAPESWKTADNISACVNAGKHLPGTDGRDDDNDGAQVFAGSFAQGGFVIPHTDGSPSAPWCHILANPVFGTLLSDRALGYTWALNSHENKLTPWLNDPASDNRGELMLVRLGGRCCDVAAGARVTFGAGYAEYASKADGFAATVVVSVAAKMPVKLVDLWLENTSGASQELSAAYYVEPVLASDAALRRHVSVVRSDGVGLMHSSWSQVSGSAFLCVPSGGFRLVTDRSDFFSGRWEESAGPSGPDVCCAAAVSVRLEPGEKKRIRFALGWAKSPQACRALAKMLADEARGANAGPFAHPREALSGDGIYISTPDAALDALFNTFLRRQFMLSRLMGRTGFYQCGGAWGFRDQLQDCCAAVLTDPDIVKTHIFRACAHQFRQGDVMHWWHQLPPGDGGSRGVRTRISDDLLWLPYTVCEYFEKTGDRTLFGAEVYYLDGEELAPDEADRYFAPQRSDERDSVFGHCVRAIERACAAVGEHGLPLFGAGDWNDGMNLVGGAGRGESVWLGMFLALVLGRFAGLCRELGDAERARDYEGRAQEMKNRIDACAWDGEWYLRGFFDDGTPLGGSNAQECRIDLLPQCFAVLADMPVEARRAKALDSALGLLWSPVMKLLRLLAPPFDGRGRDPGYISAYPPGIRENGGQYTHAALWAAAALIRMGRSGEAQELLRAINPVTRCRDRQSAQTYRLEPYAIAADIYANAACPGRGGWSLYTGAAGWYYRAVAEYMLGIHVGPDAITLSPSLPPSWNGFGARIILRGTDIELTVVRTGEVSLTVDGASAEKIPLDSGRHEAAMTF